MERDNDNLQCIVAAHDIAEIIESHFPMVLEAVAKELESLNSDMEWVLNHSRKASVSAEEASEYILEFLKEAKENEKA